ncbi:MAG: hypothetical protein Q4F17_04335 [Eubacteriales bacterium]|nr:hypothetical protein [Eubacteriales bacterium]
MEGSYGVYFGSDQVGKVQVLRQGLYYAFHCRCRLTGSVVCRLEVRWRDGRENLGVLVPMDGGFGLDTRVPIKRLKGEEPRFLIIPRHDRPTGTFVPISPEEPFSYLERLKDGYLVKKNGQIGIML